MIWTLLGLIMIGAVYAFIKNKKVVLDKINKHKNVSVIIVIILLVLLSFIIPVRKEEKNVWYRNYDISYKYSLFFYYNIYGQKIWPLLSENDYGRE